MSEPRLVRVVVSVTRLPQALTFYGDLLDLPLLHQAEGMATLSLGPSELLLHERPCDATDAAVALCLAVPDLKDAVARWAAAGGRIIDEPARQPWGETMAVVRDPDGHVVCLVQDE